MSDARSIQVAEAVKDELNAGTFSQSFTAKRKVSPTHKPYTIQELSTLRCIVVPSEWTSIIFSRNQLQTDYLVDLAFQQKATIASDGNIDTTVPDGVEKLIEETRDAFIRKRLDAYEAVCVAVARELKFELQHMDGEAVATYPLSLTLRAIE